MRFFLFLCLFVTSWGHILACPPAAATNLVPEVLNGYFPETNSATHSEGILLRPAVALTLQTDSIHHVNCLRPTGYLSVKAGGGDPAYTYDWSNGLTGPVASSLAPGFYTITVTDALGATAVASATILEDLAPPTAHAGADFTTQCANSVVSLSGSGSVGVLFNNLWVASNGGIIQSGANSLSPVIKHSGTYILKITNTGNGCAASDTILVGATFQPPSAVATGGTIKCSAPIVTLNATFNSGDIIYEWHGPAGFISGALNPQVGIPGTYSFVLTDTVTTCAGFANAPVIIDTISPAAAAGGGGIITCAQPTVALTGGGSPAGVTFAWTGPNGFASSLQNPVVNAPGNYVLTVTAPQNGCTATSGIHVTANIAPPVASASVNGVLTCVTNSVQISGNSAPASVSFSWTGPNGYTSNAQNALVFAPGLYVLTVKNPQNGCTATASATVNSNTTLPGVTAAGGVKTCANPTVMLTASSNTAGVGYSWSGSGGFSSNQQNPVVGQAGIYSVTVTNYVNGCVSSTTVNVTQNLTPPTVTASSATVTCNNPNPQVIASAQVSGATFSWTGPGGFTASIPNPQVSAGGYYTVTATSPVNGCSTLLSVYVNENTTPPFANAGEDRSLSCVFASVLANPIGTSMGNNFTYQWTTWNGHIVSGANSLYARFDTVGDYTLTVKNTQNGCTAADSMVVTQTPPVTAGAAQLNAVSCNGGNNGSAKATGGGGNGNYNYAWSNGATTATVNNLAAGTYFITITDGEGCSATTSVTITQPTALQANIATTPQMMAGVNNGTAAVVPSGGTAPYTVKWSTGAITFNIGALAPGNYTVTITDNKGCTFAKTATVNAVICAITGSVATTNVTCFGSNNGSATANISGATGTVFYMWSNNTMAKTASNLAPGNYSVTATDANGCSMTISTQITGPQQLTTGIAGQTNVLCQNSQTGTATLGVSGGVSPYTYAWSNGSNGVTASGLGVGNYSCKVTDANGCSKNQSVQITATDNNPPQLVLKNITVALNANGLATLNPALFDNGSTDECGITGWTSTPAAFDCEQKGAHVVTLTATDGNGNTASGTAVVTVVDNITPALTCPQNISVSSCAAQVAFNLPSVSDNCPLSGPASLQSGLPSGAIFPAGTTLEVYAYTDLSGNAGSCSFSVTVSEDISLDVSSTPASCAAACNGSATVTATGGMAPLQYTWNNGWNGATASGLCPGDYTVIATDASGCSRSQVVSVAAKNDPVFSVSTTITASTCGGACDGSVLLEVSGGNVPVSVQWNNGQSGIALAGLCAGNYAVVLTDASGCSEQHSVQIPVLDTEAPALICPADVTTGFCHAVVTFALPQILDNCPVDLQQVQLITGLPSGATFQVGTTTEKFRYTDTGNNSGECSFTVTVAPQLALTVNQVLNDAGGSGTGSISISVSGGVAPYSFNWTRNGQSFASTKDLTGLFAGQYAVTITDAEGCTVTGLSLTVSSSVSAGEPEQHLFWSLYPNPATTEVYVKTNELLRDHLRLDILDATGRLLREQEIQLSADPVLISLDGLPGGLLLFRLSGENGTTTRVLVKEQ